MDQKQYSFRFRQRRQTDVTESLTLDTLKPWLIGIIVFLLTAIPTGAIQRRFVLFDIDQFIQVKTVVYANPNQPIDVVIAGRFTEPDYYLYIREAFDEYTVTPETIRVNATNMEIRFRYPPRLSFPRVDHFIADIIHPRTKKSVGRFSVVKDTTAPEVRMVANSDSIKRGGSALIVLEARDVRLKDIYMIENGERIVPLQPYRKHGYFVSLLAWELGSRNYSALIVASDEAGNVSSNSVDIESRRAYYGEDKVVFRNWEEERRKLEAERKRIAAERQRLLILSNSNATVLKAKASYSNSISLSSNYSLRYMMKMRQSNEIELSNSLRTLNTQMIVAYSNAALAVSNLNSSTAQVAVKPRAAIRIIPKKWKRKVTRANIAHTPTIAEQKRDYYQALLEDFFPMNAALSGMRRVNIHALASYQPIEIVTNWDIVAFKPMDHYRITSDFGVTRRYYYGSKYLRESTHIGLDVAYSGEDDIVASNPGEVVYSGYYNGCGNTLLVYHGLGMYSLYFHCSALYYKRGDKVQRSDLIGWTGSTGIATGDHLHFSIVIHGVYVDPKEWMSPEWVKRNVVQVLQSANEVIDPLRQY